MDMGFVHKIVDRLLERALEEFDNNPLALQFIRRLSIEGSDLFFDAAMRHLKGSRESNGHRMLAILLLKRDRLQDEIVNPRAGSREDAIELVRRFLAVDPSFDVKLARRLPGRSYSSAESLTGLSAARALDVLDHTSRGRRLLPIVGHLPQSSDPKLSSKATLFVGRRVQSPAWVVQQLKRPEQRVRASAVESLWGLNGPEVLRILEGCAGDRNNRVVGNALVGLHLAGSPDAAGEILGMSRQAADSRRLTAAWALGQLKGEPFAHRLTELMRDENPAVRGMALRSSLSARRLELLRPAVGQLRPEATPLEAMAVEPESTRLALPAPQAGISLRLDGRAYHLGPP